MKRMTGEEKLLDRAAMVMLECAKSELRGAGAMGGSKFYKKLRAVLEIGVRAERKRCVEIVRGWAPGIDASAEDLEHLALALANRGAGRKS